MPHPRATHVEKIELTNFRRFEHLSVDFHPELTVLVAANGGGKTAVLDAVSIAIGYLVDELLTKGSHGFRRSDIRRVVAPTGTAVFATPVTLLCEALIDGRPTNWRRELATAEGKTTFAGATALKDRAGALRHELQDFAEKRRTDPPPLPLIAYYGTGRLWAEHKATKNKKSAATDLDLQVGAYVDCLSSRSSFHQFEAWFEAMVREAQNELQANVPSRHQPARLLAAVRRAIDIVLAPSGWCSLDWDFIAGEVIARHPEHGTLPVDLLSDGIQNLVALVADLAHRAARLNPHFGEESCQKTPGLVLIDEVDMHLHPGWQQLVVGALREAFPEVQFVLTTHSHLVISTVAAESIRILHGDGTCSRPTLETRGADIALALGEVFGVDGAPPLDVTRQLARFRELVEMGEAAAEEAVALRSTLREHFGVHHPAMLELESAIRRYGLRHRGAPSA